MSSVGAFWTLSNPIVCTGFIEALMPNIVIEVCVPNQDCDGLAFPQLEHVSKFHSLFAKLCGGHAPPVIGPGHYRPSGSEGSNENTIVVKACLPEVVTEGVRYQLLAAILSFGEETRQQEVLVIIGGFGHRFKFKVGLQKEEHNSVVPRAKVA